jgi:hypothetical protein
VMFNVIHDIRALNCKKNGPAYQRASGHSSTCYSRISSSLRK